MARTIIPWGDGSGGNIYLDYTAASGDQTVAVSSDANNGAARSKNVTFSAPGVTPVVLTVAQDPSGPPFYGYTTLGSPTVENNIVATNGLGGIKTPVQFTPGDATWDIIFRVKFDTLADWGTALGTRDVNDAQFKSIALQTRTNGRVYVYISSNGSSYDLLNGNKVMGTPNNWIKFKLSFNGSLYNLSYYSNDSWVNWISKSGSSKIYNNGQSGYISFGQWFDNGTFYNNMLLDLTETEIYIGGQLWWRPLAPTS